MDEIISVIAIIPDIGNVPQVGPFSVQSTCLRAVVKVISPSSSPTFSPGADVSLDHDLFLNANVSFPCYPPILVSLSTHNLLYGHLEIVQSLLTSRLIVSGHC